LQPSLGHVAMSQIRRRQLLVDAKLQGALVLQVTLYWFYCLLTVAMLALIWIVFIKRPLSSADLFQELWMSCGPALLGSVLLLPLVLLDCVRVSNRFAGPMLRISREMKALAEGKVSRSVQLREGDFWLEFAEDWNQVLHHCENLRTAPDQALASQPAIPLPAEQSAVTTRTTVAVGIGSKPGDSVSA
jgi:hypothetical protein